MRKLAYILLFFATVINAQQFTIPSQIDRNLLYLNPAFAGFYETTVASAMYKSQWSGVPGALSFQNVEFHTPLKKQSMALGLQAKHESIGLKDNTEAFFTYAYRVRFDKSTLAFALKAGGNSISYQDAQLDNSDDKAFAKNGSMLPNAGFGLAYYHTNYYFGVSIPYFFGSFANADGTSQIDFDINRLNYIATLGGNFKAGEDFKIKPNAAVFYSMVLKPQVTANINVEWQDMFLLGVGYRLSEAFMINAAYLINKQLSIAYTYDYNIGKIGAFSKGSHEIGLLYYFGYKVNTISPRDF